MKGTKLLTTAAALALVLSVGGCSGEEPLPEPSEVIATTPAELVEKANTYGNYSLEIWDDYYESTSTITYEEYLSAAYGDADATAKLNGLYDTLVYNMSVVWYIYYDVDYIYTEGYYVYGGTYYELGLIDIAVNTQEGLWEYYSYDGSSWNYYTPEIYSLYLGATKWQDVYSSLFDAGESGVADHLEYYPSYDLYDFDDWTYNYNYGYISAASAEWFCDIGGEWVDGSDAYDDAYEGYFYHYGTLFDEDSQELTSIYVSDLLYYTDYSYANLCLGEDDYYFTIYDVGTTDVRETVDYYHDYFQSLLN